MNRVRIATSLLAVVMVLAWTGCGGGGGGGSTYTPPPVTPPPPPPLSITTPSLPDGRVGAPYSATAAASGGTGALVWSLGVGSPAWMSINATTGMVTGTPDSVGWMYANIVVQDSGTPQQAVTASLLLQVYGTISVNPSSLSATLGVPYSSSISIANGKSPYSVTVTGLPDGLTYSLNGSWITFSGTPAASGSFNLSVHMVDSESTPQTVDATVSCAVDTKLTVLTQKLADAVYGRAYADKIRVANGVPPLKYVANGLPQGLTLNPDTGDITGMPTGMSGSAWFSVTDSSPTPQVAYNYGLWINVFQPLAALKSKLDDAHLGALFSSQLWLNGGRYPYTQTMIDGSLPPGLQFSQGTISGIPTATGTYSFGVHIEDSLTPPLVLNNMFSITVLPPTPLFATAWLPDATLGKSYTAQLKSKGGTPPYSYALASYSNLPPGLTVAADGTLSGTPQRVGTYSVAVQFTDSATPPQANSGTVSLVVDASVLPRNDTIATATPIGGTWMQATISPYADPVNIANPDTDYYKLFALAGSIVTIDVRSTSPVMDPVLEIVDGNGTRFTTCKDPGNDNPPSPAIPDATPTTFDDECLNDDIQLGVDTNSHLDFQVPGTAGQTVTFYAHVLDSRGDARPDMSYTLQYLGVLEPLQISDLTNWFVLGTATTLKLQSNGGTGQIVWSLAPGSGPLPAGVTLDATGTFGGTPSTAGTYSFTVQATDSETPPQVATRTFSGSVTQPLAIVPSTLPQGTTGVPYNVVFSLTGGTGQYSDTTIYVWPSLPSYSGLTVIDSNQNRGLFGTPQAVGTFAVEVQANNPNSSAFVNLSLTIVPGPLYISTTSVAGGYVGWNYQAALQAAGGTNVLSWSVDSGSMPPGLTLKADGTVYGVPTTAGSYPATLRVTDAASPPVSKTVTLTFNIAAGNP